jgi:hypothetical protein
MKYTSLFFLGIVFLLASCKKSCTGCNANQVCNNGACQCKDWYEGANCETAMSAKFVGAFIGNSYINGTNSYADTFVFDTESTHINILDRTNHITPFHIGDEVFLFGGFKFLVQQVK